MATIPDPSLRALPDRGDIDQVVGSTDALGNAGLRAALRAAFRQGMA